ncbi:synaptonemal complex central element protein 3 isoform X1 [Pogona vitticeps]
MSNINKIRPGTGHLCAPQPLAPSLPAFPGIHSNRADCQALPLLGLACLEREGREEGEGERRQSQAITWRTMAKYEPYERNYDNTVKMLEDLNKDLEKLLEDMEKLSVQATWMAYDMVVMRTNPDLANSMRRLEDAFLTCKEEMEKNWREMLKETKSVAQKQE